MTPPAEFNGKPLKLNQYEDGRSLAIAADGSKFVLGTNWNLRAFEEREFYETLHYVYISPASFLAYLMGRASTRFHDASPDATKSAIAREAVEIGAKVLWIQLGLHSDEAVRIAHEAGLKVVTNRCIKIEHARFAGGLHLAGFDTGVISSRRTRG